MIRTALNYLMLAVLTISLAIFVLLFAAVDKASAQSTRCAPVATYEGRLSEVYGERPVWMGITNGSRVVIYGDPDRRTFTITIVNEAGIGCLVAAGQAWHEIEVSTSAPGEEG